MPSEPRGSPRAGLGWVLNLMTSVLIKERFDDTEGGQPPEDRGGGELQPRPANAAAFAGSQENSWKDPLSTPRGSLALRHRDVRPPLPEPEPTDVCPLNPPRCGSLCRSLGDLIRSQCGSNFLLWLLLFPPQECELLLQLGIIPQCVCLGLSKRLEACGWKPESDFSPVAPRGHLSYRRCLRLCDF